MRLLPVILCVVTVKMQFLNSTQFFSKNSTVRKLFVSVVCVALFALLTQLGAGTSAQTTAKSDTLKPLTDIPAKAEKVETGIFAMNLYNLDASSNTYYLDFYIWFKWKGNIDPTVNLEYTNGVEDWGAISTPAYEEPQKLPDGRLYQALRVEGRFVEPFALSRYPLDQQSLKVLIENSVYQTNELVYVADKGQSGYSGSLSIPGWKIRGFDVSTLAREYTTNFGDDRLGKTTQYSSVQYSLKVTRPISFFVWKLLLPLIIVVAASWGALLLHPQHVDSRIILPVTALLTTVFLQQSYSSALPDIGYLVLLDKIYAIAYVLIIVSILEAILTADWIKNEKLESYAQVARLDRTVLAVQTAVLILGVALIILLP